MSPLRFAWLQLVRDRMTSAVAWLALALALVGALLILSLGRSLLARGGELDTPFQVIVGPKTNGLSIVLDALTLADPPEDVIPYGMRGSLYEHFPGVYAASVHVVTRWQDTWVLATEDAWLARPAPLASPRIVEGRWMQTDNDVVIGVRAAERLGLSVGDGVAYAGAPSQAMLEAARAREPERTFIRSFDALARPFDEVGERPLWRAGGRIVGVIDHDDPIFDDAIWVHRGIGELKHRIAYDDGLARRVSSNGATTFLYVHVPDPALLPEIERAVHRNSTTMYAEVERERASLSALRAGSTRGTRWLVGVVLASVMLGIAVLVNVRFDALRPRIALLRALGYGPRWVITSLAAESLALVVGAWVIAAGAAWGITVTLASWRPAAEGLDAWLALAPLRPADALLVLGLGASAALLATLVPALRMARTSASTSLPSLG